MRLCEGTGVWNDKASHQSATQEIRDEIRGTFHMPQSCCGIHQQYFGVVLDRQDGQLYCRIRLDYGIKFLLLLFFFFKKTNKLGSLRECIFSAITQVVEETNKCQQTVKYLNQQQTD